MNQNYVALREDSPYPPIGTKNEPAVTVRHRIGWFLRRRPVLFAVCSLPLIILSATYMFSHRSWQQRTAALQRENLTLQLRQLALSITKESSDLATVARGLAETDGALEFVQEGGGPIAPAF